MSDIIDFNTLKASGILPSPKGVALTVMRLCQRENVSLQELAHAIQGDPVLAGRIIKVANVANPNKSRPIASITTDTLILIGIHAVRQVVLGFSLITHYRDGECPGFDYPLFWSRSAAMASVAQAIGGATRLAPPAEIFTCGLLAGIGRLCLAVACPAAYGEVLAKHRAGFGAELIQAENARFGMDHNALAAAMMEDWGFPRLFIDAVAFHENPDASGLSEGSRPRKLAYTLELAALLGDAFVTQTGEELHITPQMLEIAGILALTPEQLIGIADQSAREWRDWGALLNVKTHTLSSFDLPDAQAEAANASPSLAQELPPVQPMRILVADDDDSLTFMLNKLLTTAGHTVYVARDGKQAMEIALEKHPQVVIADWLMPHLDGLSLCRKLRETTAGRHMHYMILTTLEDDRRQIEAFEAGVDEYMRKPLNVRLLNAKLLVAQRRFEANTPTR